MSEVTWNMALAESGVPASDTMVQRILFTRQTIFPVFPLYELVVAVSEEDLPKVFRLFVYLFGIAEGAAYRSESKEWCNHWWHRDLLTIALFETC